MSEDEDDLVENIIKVFVTTKREAKKSTSKQNRKDKNPKILVTDHSNNDIKDLVTFTLGEDISDKSSSLWEEKSVENLQISGNEFESEPSDLMPDSFLSYLSSCKNLIGDISSYKEERLDADDWIGQFDQTISDAEKAAKENEELERLQLQKIEERRKKIEQRRLMRKINKPLINPVPDPLGSYSTHHDKVCLLTLEQLKRCLKKYQPVLDSRFQSRSSRVYEKKPKSTSKVITLMNLKFEKFLKRELDKIELLPLLNVQGNCLFPPQLCKNENGKSSLKTADKEPIKKMLSLENILFISKKEKTSSNMLKEKTKLRWTYDNKQGILTSNSKKKIPKSKTIQTIRKVHIKYVAKKKGGIYIQPKVNKLKKLIIAEQEKLIKFIIKAKKLLNDYDARKTVLKQRPQTKPKDFYKNIVQVITLL